MQKEVMLAEQSWAGGAAEPPLVRAALGTTVTVGLVHKAKLYFQHRAFQLGRGFPMWWKCAVHSKFVSSFYEILAKKHGELPSKERKDTVRDYFSPF